MPVQPLSVDQGTPEWWMLQSFAITSTSAFNFLAVLGRIFNPEDEDEDKYFAESFQNIIDCLPDGKSIYKKGNTTKQFDKYNKQE